MAYKFINANIIQRLEDTVFIPVDLNNSDYKTFLIWQAAGNMPIAADPVMVADPSDATTTSDKLLKATAIYLGSLLGKTPNQVAAGIKAVYQALP